MQLNFMRTILYHAFHRVNEERSDTIARRRASRILMLLIMGFLFRLRSIGMTFCCFSSSISRIIFGFFTYTIYAMLASGR